MSSSERPLRNTERNAATGLGAAASEPGLHTSADDAAARPAKPIRFNRATAIMLAAANIDTDALERNFRERDEQPFRADLREHGLDIALIREEVRRARRAALKTDVPVLVLSLIWLGLALNSMNLPQPANEQAMGLLIVLFAATALLIFLDARRAKARVRQLFALGSEDWPSAMQQPGNLTVSGGYSPFAGSGAETTGWAFTVNVQKPEHEGKPVEPLDVHDLYRETEDVVRGLQLPVLSIKDEFFVDGRDAQRLPFLFTRAFPTQPRVILPDGEAADYIEHCNTMVRHYKAIRLELWGGQLVLSVFVKYVKLATALFVETRVFLLPPLAPKFSNHEDLPRRERMADIRNDLALSVAYAIVAWMSVLWRLYQFISKKFQFSSYETRSRKAILRAGSYNFGWPASYREAWSSRNFERYFQQVDDDLYTKMLKEALLDGLIASLEKRNICTAGLAEATTKIFNDGIILTGGSVQAENLAVGNKASAASSRTSTGAKP